LVLAMGPTGEGKESMGTTGKGKKADMDNLVLLPREETAKKRPKGVDTETPKTNLGGHGYSKKKGDCLCGFSGNTKKTAVKPYRQKLLLNL